MLPDTTSSLARDVLEGVTAELQRGYGIGEGDSPGDPWMRNVRRVGGRSKSVFTEGRSYKEALLREFLQRRDQRRNAVLADVIQPANLGPEPTSTIANALARRFGGYTQDFPVSRFRERDFAIFLPEWVSAEVIARREILTLDGFWLRCFAWGPYRDARPHRMVYRAWIRLINLPFECWTVPRVAAIVCGFGRFIKADEVTKAMTDLRAFRCQIILDTLTDIPQNLSIVLGEERYPVMVHLESWERAVDEARGDPPGPPPGGNGDGNQQGEGDRPDIQANIDQEMNEEATGEDEGEIDDAGPVSAPSRRTSSGLEKPTTLCSLPFRRSSLGLFGPAGTSERRGGRAETDEVGPEPAPSRRSSGGSEKPTPLYTPLIRRPSPGLFRRAETTERRGGGRAEVDEVRRGQAEVDEVGSENGPNRRSSGGSEESPPLRSPGLVGRAGRPGTPVWSRHPQCTSQCSPPARRPPARALGWMKAGQSSGLASGLASARTEEGQCRARQPRAPPGRWIMKSGAVTQRGFEGMGVVHCIRSLSPPLPNLIMAGVGSDSYEMGRPLMLCRGDQVLLWVGGALFKVVVSPSVGLRTNLENWASSIGDNRGALPVSAPGVGVAAHESSLGLVDWFVTTGRDQNGQSSVLGECTKSMTEDGDEADHAKEKRSNGWEGIRAYSGKGLTSSPKKSLITPTRARSFIDKCVFLESNGASGGLITCWSSRVFSCKEVIVRNYSISVLLELVSCGTRFFVTNVYGPASWDGKEDFFSELLLLKDYCKELTPLPPNKTLLISQCSNGNEWCWNKILRGVNTSDHRVQQSIVVLKDRISTFGIRQGMDSVYWRWTSDGRFSVKSTYTMLNNGGTRDYRTCDIWRLRIPLKVKVFCWLVLTKKIPTIDNLLKRGWTGNTSCVLCGNARRLIHVDVLLRHTRWKFPVEGVKKVGERDLDCFEPEVLPWADPATFPKWYQIEVLSGELEIRAIHEPLWLERLRRFPVTPVPSDCPSIDVYHCIERDIIAVDFEMPQRCSWEQHGSHRVQPHGLLHNALEVAQWVDVALLYLSFPPDEASHFFLSFFHHLRFRDDDVEKGGGSDLAFSPESSQNYTSSCIMVAHRIASLPKFAKLRFSQILQFWLERWVGRGPINTDDVEKGGGSDLAFSSESLQNYTNSRMMVAHGLASLTKLPSYISVKWFSSGASRQSS
ncbi:hypothetical protein ACMD2_25377 [Ananas comosus]|uniref:Reverse transcriptase zinc-binding domain-containing protein n=1 Tax=Ananas comosus TaxID=4615 RepID=A0A199V0T2_ANACO|nr:hypothetical protein ACMD2_25377 [Ananas comosus]